MNNLSTNVQSALLADLNDSALDITDLRSAYSPDDRFYLLSLPKASGSTEVGTTWLFDTRGRLQDGSARCLGNWSGLIPTVLIKRTNQDLLSANRANTGELFKYFGQKDDTAKYTFSYRSGWSDIGAPAIIKILKRITGVFFADDDTSVAFKWAWDFEDTFSTVTRSFAILGTGGNWDEALWDTDVWAGAGAELREGSGPASGTGRYIKYGIDVSIDGNIFSLQQLELYAKLGRLG
jgi:hypothetical protein